MCGCVVCEIGVCVISARVMMFEPERYDMCELGVSVRVYEAEGVCVRDRVCCV